MGKGAKKSDFKKIYEVSFLLLFLQSTLIMTPISFWDLDEDEVKSNMFNEV